LATNILSEGIRASPSASASPGRDSVFALQTLQDYPV